MSGKNLLIGDAAVRLGVPESMLRKLIRTGVIEAPRVGRYFAFPEDRMPDYRAALERVGHVRQVPDVRA